MWSYCSTNQGTHSRKVIGYEKLAEGPRYEDRGSSLAVIGQAHFRYWVVWVCESCARTWWVEDHPRTETAAAVS